MPPIVETISSVSMIPESTGTMGEATPRQITASATTQTSITSADLSTYGTAIVGLIAEALNGNCKGQKLWILAFDDSTDIATTTQHWSDTPTTTRYKLWQSPLRAIISTSGSAVNTEIVDTDRTEATDIFGGKYRALCMQGLYNGGDDVAISAFNTSTNTFTVGAMTNVSMAGDFYVPRQPIQASEVTIVPQNEMAIEREVSTDGLDTEGIVVGAQESPSVEMKSEVRGLATAASDGVEASGPGELHLALSSAFTEALSTGDTDQGGSSATVVNVSDGTRFPAYTMGLHEDGDMFGVSSVSTNALTVPVGHLNNAPVSGDNLFGGACYQPKNTPDSVAFLAWTGQTLLRAVFGCVPGLNLSITGDQKVELSWAYRGVFGIMADFDQPHSYDTYDTAQPLVGKSNVSRFIYGGNELDAVVVSVEGSLLSEPTKVGAAFGAAENNGGQFYTARDATLTVVLQMEDTEEYQRYLSAETNDMLIQVGRVATSAFGIWVPRAQQVAPPEVSEADGFLNLTLQIRALRPSVAGQPAYTMCIC